MHTIHRHDFESIVDIDSNHEAQLIAIANELELTSICLISTHTLHHSCNFLHTRIDEVNTIDCEGDEVPMTIVKTVTRHYTQIVIYQGANIINLPQID